jgi:pentatricopeptide repeat protein
MYAKCGSLEKARQVFDLLPIHDVVSWNLMISGYVEHEHGEEALRCLEQMQAKGVAPDAVTFICSLKACGNTGAMEKAGEIHGEIERQGLLGTNLVIGNTLIDMYSKCGLLAKARGVFDLLPVRDVISWTALMAGYAQIGEYEKAFEMFEQMLQGGMSPNPVTFVVLLCACGRRGLFSKSQSYFEAMTEEHGIFPSLQHHSCMVDVFGRAGDLDAALTMIQRSPFSPNLVMWQSVLNACKKWGNVRCGQHAFVNATMKTEYFIRNDSFHNEN